MRGDRVFSAECYVLLMVLVVLAIPMISDGMTYIPAIDPKTKRIKFFPVSSTYLVLDPIRNPKYEVTINSYSDFLNYPNLKSNSHFIAIGDTGNGMTIAGNSAYEINDEINKIFQQLPRLVREKTHYQRKSVAHFPNFNEYTGPLTRTHSHPHQVYFRNATITYIN